jgi:hypothetical protein
MRRFEFRKRCARSILRCHGLGEFGGDVSLSHNHVLFTHQAKKSRRSNPMFFSEGRCTLTKLIPTHDLIYVRGPKSLR